MGIQSMYELPSFREAASKATKLCQETPLSIDPIELWKALPRQAKHQEAKQQEAEQQAKQEEEDAEIRRRTYYTFTLKKNMNMLSNIFRSDIEYAMNSTTDPKEKARLFLKHDGTIREYIELVYHMRTFPYALRNYDPQYERMISAELRAITLDKLTKVAPPKRRKRLSVAAKANYSKEWRKLNVGYHRTYRHWHSYCKEHRPSYLEKRTINNMTPAKMRLLRRVYRDTSRGTSSTNIKALQAAMDSRPQQLLQRSTATRRISLA